MARTFTLAELRTDLRELCDIENDLHPTDTALNKILSRAYGKFYAELVKHNLGYAAETTVSWATDGVTQTKALASDFMGLVSVEFSSGSFWYPLEEIDAREVSYIQAPGQPASWYRLVDTNLVLHPLPPVGTYRYTYVPAPAKLTTDGQTVDGVTGWEDGILFEAAIRVVMKRDEFDRIAGFQSERDKIWARIQEEAQLRNVHAHRRIVRRPPWRRRPSDFEDGYRWDPSDFAPAR